MRLIKTMANFVLGVRGVRERGVPSLWRLHYFGCKTFAGQTCQGSGGACKQVMMVCISNALDVNFE